MKVLRYLPAAWRERWWLWVLPAVLVVANLIVLLLTQSRGGDRSAAIAEALQSEQETSTDFTAREQRLISLRDRVAKNRAGILDLYDDRLRTEQERLTLLIQEVKSLARRAGIEPPRIAYPEQEIEEFGLVKKSLVFRVSGSYQQIRRLVNFLELSDYFLVLEAIRLRESGSSQLGIDLVIATYFRADERPLVVESGSTS